MLGEWLRQITDRAFASFSAGAFLFAAICVAVATLVRYLLGSFNPDIVLFAAHFPAVLVVALLAGAPAALAATLLSILTAIPLFGPPGPVTRLDIINSVFFAVSCLLMIVVAEAYRQLVARYKSQEKLKNLMVRELEHRGKNTFSVVESIVVQTLAHDPETAKVITGRIRAVSSTRNSRRSEISAPASVAATSSCRPMPRAIFRSSSTNWSPMRSSTARCRGLRAASRFPGKPMTRTSRSTGWSVADRTLRPRSSAVSARGSWSAA
jgi:hypothetical protein